MKKLLLAMFIFAVSFLAVNTALFAWVIWHRYAF